MVSSAFHLLFRYVIIKLGELKSVSTIYKHTILNWSRLLTAFIEEYLPNQILALFPLLKRTVILVTNPEADKFELLIISLGCSRTLLSYNSSNIRRSSITDIGNSFS
jgi:hypothetical protein